MKTEQSRESCQGGQSESENATSTWDKRRAVLLKRGSPHCRFRTEAFWNPQALQNLTGLTQKETDIFIISIRAIGAHVCEVSLPHVVQALKDLGITALLIQRQENDHNWPSQWLVHIKSVDVDKLPDFFGQNKGIFWNCKYDLNFFIWCVLPLDESEMATLEGRYLKVEAHFTATAPCTDGLLTLITQEGMDLHSDKLSIRDAKYRGARMIDTVVNVGNLVLTVDKLPRDSEFVALIRDNNKSYVEAWWHGNSATLRLDPACDICGTEGHPPHDCIYQPVLDSLVSLLTTIKMRKLANQQMTHLDVASTPIPTPTNTNRKRKSDLDPPDTSASKSKKKKENNLNPPDTSASKSKKKKENNLNPPDTSASKTKKKKSTKNK